MTKISRITDFAHQLVRPYLYPGATVVDATAGNGHDTVFLINEVGAEGHVFSFDKSQEAYNATRDKIEQIPLFHVSLIMDGHEHLSHYIDKEVTVFLYNLGYLPGHKDNTATLPETTLSSLHQALKLLAVLGVIQIVFYKGHPEGRAEFDAVMGWVKGLDDSVYKAVHLDYINSVAESPSILMIQRLQ